MQKKIAQTSGLLSLPRQTVPGNDTPVVETLFKSLVLGWTDLALSCIDCI